MRDGKAFRGRTLERAEFRDCAMAGTRFDDVDLSQARFTDVALRGARFEDVNLAGASIEDADITGMTVLGHDLRALIDARAGPPAAAESRMASEPQLFVRDIDRAIAFYARLGFATTFRHGDPPFYAQVVRGGWRLNLRRVSGPVFAPDFRQREADALSAMLTIDDLRPVYREYQAAGLAFHQALREEAWGASTFILRDPDDNLVGFAGAAG